MHLSHGGNTPGAGQANKCLSRDILRKPLPVSALARQGGQQQHYKQLQTSSTSTSISSMILPAQACVHIIPCPGGHRTCLRLVMPAGTCSNTPPIFRHARSTVSTVSSNHIPCAHRQCLVQEQFQKDTAETSHHPRSVTSRAEGLQSHKAIF